MKLQKSLSGVQEKTFLAHCIRISPCFTWTENSYLIYVISPSAGKKSREFNALVVWKVMYLCHQVTLVFTAHDVKKCSLCKLDINVKKRTVVAGSVGFFKLEQKFLLYSKFYFENQM